MFGVHPLRRSRYTEKQCTAELAEILETSPRITKLLQTIFALSKDSLKRGITCRSCFGTVQEGRAGYYDGGHKRIVICSDKVQSKEHLEETVVHELVHAFDFARSGRFQSFCHMIACAEVRASLLGQCYNIKSPSKKNECIWRDAVNSTAKDCGGLDLARLYVQQVFDSCINDTAPFEPNIKKHQETSA